MLLYCTPGGTWAGSEKDYKAALKAEGVDPKTVTRRQVDVPVSKAALMEFLTFHNVNPINPRRVPQVTVGEGPSPTPAPSPAVAPQTPGYDDRVDADVEALFNEATLDTQLRLSFHAINRARASLPK